MNNNRFREFDKKEEDQNLDQIEYLLYQSTQGFHFMFDHSEIVKVLKRHNDDKDFFTFTNMGKVQDMLTHFIEKPTMEQKRRYLESLGTEEYELLIRAYFHLVENTILANSNIRH